MLPIRERLAPLQAKHALLLGLAFCASIPYGMHAAASLLVGGGIQILNLRALERSVRLITDRQVAGLGLVLSAARFVLLISVVLLLFWATPLHRLALGIGLLLVVPAALWHGLETARANARES
jgi:hypothetical protein